ncbi:MAG: hypothetical protein Q3995_00980 [Eubacteriales bacterium]|nr:hypothetical protein [Eubacteriales bacterium]
MKRIATAFLALVMVFSLAACGSSSKGPKLEGAYTNEQCLIGAIQFNKDGTFYICGCLDLESNENNSEINATYCGTFAIGDDNKTIYLKDEDNSIGTLVTAISYDTAADVVVVTISGVTYNFFKSDVVLKLPTDNDAAKEEVQDETTGEEGSSITPPWVEEMLNSMEETDSKQESSSDDVGYDEWAEAADEPYKQRTYYGQTAEALAAVKAHCTWYDSWVKSEFPNGLTNGYYCDWQIDQVSDTTWIGSLFAADFSGAWSPYEFTVEYNGTEYVITQEQDNR